MKPMGLANFRDFGHRSSRSSDAAPNEAQHRLSLANFRGLGRRSTSAPDVVQRRSSGLANFRGLGRRSSSTKEAQRRSFSTGSRDSDTSTI